MGCSEARCWNTECINTYKVSTIVISDYIPNIFSEGNLYGHYIYIKSNFGITHFAHKYTEPHMLPPNQSF